MSAVSVSEPGVRPILAEAVELARRALLDLQPDGVGEHLGVTAEDQYAATHHFASTLPGYRGWQWAVVVAAPPEAARATVSESALLPGPDALTAPEFIPWDRRVRPGDLAPGDLLAPPPDDPRLVPGYLVTGDPVVDEVAEEIGQGRSQVLSREGREEAAERWFTEYGPDTDMARAAPSTCRQCGFFVPLAGALRAAYGVCANAMGADGHVVHVEYGCGAHSDTELPTGGGSPQYEAYDDAAVEVISEGELRGSGTPVDELGPAEPTAEAPSSGDESADASETVADASESQAPEAAASVAEALAPVVEDAVPVGENAASMVEDSVLPADDTAPLVGDVAPVTEGAAPVVEDSALGAGDPVTGTEGAASVVGDAAPVAENDVPVIETVTPGTDVARGRESASVVAVPEVDVARQTAEFAAAFAETVCYTASDFAETVCYTAESDSAERATDSRDVEPGAAQASSVDTPMAGTSTFDTVSSVPQDIEDAASSVHSTVADSAEAQEFPAPAEEPAVGEAVATDADVPADSVSPVVVQDFSGTASTSDADTTPTESVGSPETSGGESAPTSDDHTESNEAERSTIEPVEVTEEVQTESGAPFEPGEAAVRSDVAESDAQDPEHHDAWAGSSVQHVAEGGAGASEQG